MPMFGSILMIEVTPLQLAFLVIDVFTAISRGAIVNLDEAAMMGYILERLGKGIVTAMVQAASS